MASQQQQQTGTTSSAPTYPPAPPAVPPTPHPLAVLERYRPTTSGAVWRRSRLSIFSLIGATVILVTWIVAAVWLYAIDFFLPLDFFGGLEDPTGENGERFFHWSNRMYNNLITLLGTLSWVVISYALAVGFTTILRREFVKEDGVSLSTFEALVKLSSQSLQLKFRWSAIVALAVFAVAQLYPTATQAAFGSTSSYQLPRVSTNLGAFDVDGVLSRYRYVRLIEDTNRNLLSVLDLYRSDVNRTSRNIEVAVGSTNELANRGTPLFETTFLADDTQNPFKNKLPPAEQDLLSSSPGVRVATTVEGFFADAYCTQVAVNCSRTRASAGAFYLYNLTFPSATTSVFYTTAPLYARERVPDNSTTIVADYFAPATQPSLVYVFTVDLGLKPSATGYSCTFSARSTLVQIHATTQRPPFRAGVSGLNKADFTAARLSKKPPCTVAYFPPGPVLAQTLQEGPFRTRGMFGFEMLGHALSRRMKGNEAKRRAVEHLVETAIKLRLVQLAATALVAAGTDPIKQLTYERQEQKIEVEALQLHLSNLAWLVVPIVLLVAVLLIFPLFFATTGMVDFTDPLSTTLIALNSPPDPYVYGACTGDFPDDLSQATTGGKSKARAVKLRYGKYEWAQRGPPPHLAMAADPAVKAGLDAPVRGKEYA
ncbi:hypothetical protein JCM6882_009704 [Rhodosporidiobolus microsporus]